VAIPRGCRVLFFFTHTVDIRHRKILLDFSSIVCNVYRQSWSREKGSKLVSKPNWAEVLKPNLEIVEEGGVPPYTTHVRRVESWGCW